MRRLSRLALACLLAATALGCAVPLGDPTLQDGDADGSGGSAFPDTADESSRYRAAWDEYRPLALGEPREDQRLYYQPYEHVYDQDGNIIDNTRPDDAWTEIGRYSVEVTEPGLLHIDVYRTEPQRINPLGQLILIRRAPENDEDAGEVSAVQSDTLDLQVEEPGTYQVVIIPMIATSVLDFYYYNIIATEEA